MNTTILIGIIAIVSIFFIIFIYNLRDKSLNKSTLYKIKGCSGYFRYVHKNVFRDCKTGRLKAVSYGSIREVNVFDKLFNPLRKKI